MKLVVSLATRGRGQQLINTVTQNMKMLSRADTKLFIQCDDDDYETLGRLTNAKLDPRAVVNVQKREDTIAAKWNRAMSEPADVYVVAADDDPYMLPDTDERILNAAKLFPDGIGMVYGHNANASFSSIVAPTAKLVERLGYIQPEHFPYWFCDHWTDDISRMIGRIVYADVVTDQRGAGQTQEMREPGWWATWFDAAYILRRREAIKLLGDIDEPEWRKAMAVSAFTSLAYRSRWINDNVRNGYKGVATLDLNDERYQRVKRKAADRVPELLSLIENEAERAAFRDALIPATSIISIPRAYSRA